MNLLGVLLAELIGEGCARVTIVVPEPCIRQFALPVVKKLRYRFNRDLEGLSIVVIATLLYEVLSNFFLPG